MSEYTQDEINGIKALRFNDGKAQLHYLRYYPKFLHAFAAVQEQGEIKYGYGNWLLGGKPVREYYDSAERHWTAHFNGELYDKEGGFLHIAAAIWNMIQVVERCMQEIPVLDPDFDQDAYKERWADSPKNENDNLEYWK